jgi:hypothetical protein
MIIYIIKLSILDTERYGDSGIKFYVNYIVKIKMKMSFILFFHFILR